MARKRIKEENQSENEMAAKASENSVKKIMKMKTRHSAILPCPPLLCAVYAYGVENDGGNENISNRDEIMTYQRSLTAVCVYQTVPPSCDYSVYTLSSGQPL